MLSPLHNQLLLDVALEHQRELLREVELLRLLAEERAHSQWRMPPLAALISPLVRVAERLKLRQPATV